MLFRIMSNRRKSTRLSIKTSQSPTSSLGDATKASLVDCSPSSSASDLALLASPKTSKLNKNQQHIKSAVKKSPRGVISTLLNINQLKIPAVKATKRPVATLKSKLLPKKSKTTSKTSKKTLPKKAACSKKSNRRQKKESHRNASLLLGDEQIFTSVVRTLPVPIASTPASPDIVFTLNTLSQSTPRPSPSLLSTSLLYASASTSGSTFVNPTSSPLSSLNPLLRAPPPITDNNTGLGNANRLIPMLSMLVQCITLKISDN